MAESGPSLDADALAVMRGSPAMRQGREEPPSGSGSGSGAGAGAEQVRSLEALAFVWLVGACLLGSCSVLTSLLSASY